MHKHRKLILLLLGNLIAFLIVSTELKAQGQPYIYGKVSTYSSEYIGQIQWGDEEAIWFDLFNAEKAEKTVEVDKNDWTVSRIWTEIESSSHHQFNCQFGEIKEISGIGKSRFTLVLKNGTSIVLNGNGYNDAGSTLVVGDMELGTVEISWNKIKKVEFMEAPGNLIPMTGEHLFGTVNTTRHGDVRGFVIWDNDERLGDEKLDGDTKGQELSIPFKNIASIEKDGDGCEVELKSGRSFYLTGSNDVDDGNRGVMVMDPEIGFVEIPWKYFDKIEFSEPDSGLGYSYFKTPKGIFGQVYTRNGNYSGRLVYDLDEFWELEMIEGKDDGLEYRIPIRNIRRIEPKNSEYSEVQMKNGTTLLLGKLRDISSSNAGLLIIDKNNKTKHVRWENIEEIVFD